MRCDQCQFWSDEKAGYWEADEIGFRPCEAVRERWTIMDSVHEGVKHPQFDADDKPSRKQWAQERIAALGASRAYVEDGSEYHAELLTGPDFFCALFKQK